MSNLFSYIEKKGASFPRFYFLSNPVILEILGQATDPHAIQPHLQSIFDNLVHLDFDPVQYNKVLAMRSNENEIVNFTNPFAVQGNVEVWLNDLVTRMRQTIRDICSDMAQRMASFTVDDWVNAQFPAQILLLSMMLWWTDRTEEALKNTKSKAKRVGRCAPSQSAQLSQEAACQT